MPTVIDLSKTAAKQEWTPGAAESAASAVVRDAAEDADLLHELGLSAIREKDYALAISRLARAIHVGGATPDYCESLAGALHASGKLRQSAVCYEQAIAGNPGEVRLHVNLARVLMQDNRAAAAADVLKQGIRLAPDAAEAWALLGGALNLQKQNTPAAEALERAVELDPGAASYHFDLGLVLGQLGDLHRSEAAYRRALEVRPQFPEALNNLGNLLRRSGGAAEAVTCYRRALRYRPGYTDANYNLGLALQSLGRLDDAETCYRSLLETVPAHHAASNNYGNVLMALGRIHEALPRFEQAVRLAPSSREYRVNAGMAQLVNGDFREGWRNYSARIAPVVPGAKLWAGEHLRDKRILLVGEQGLGDTIQFIRFARPIREEGGRVQVLCPAPLAELLRTATGVEQVVEESQDPPACDWYAPLLHLPAVFGTRPGTIPSGIPYLFADPGRVHNWQATLPARENRLRIGVAWRGGSDHWNDRNRSMDSSFLRVLSGVPSVTFVSLQKGYRAGCEELEFTPLPRDLLDFADTAALMVHLDLVVSVDTSVAHLAGALGRPTWVLLPFAPDWRWMLDRNDSPWYPGMRLFRQERRGDWGPVLEKVREALLGLAGNPK